MAVNRMIMTISITKELREQIREQKQVNWSAVAREAFEEKLRGLESPRAHALELLRKD